MFLTDTGILEYNLDLFRLDVFSIDREEDHTELQFMHIAL